MTVSSGEKNIMELTLKLDLTSKLANVPVPVTHWENIKKKLYFYSQPFNLIPFQIYTSISPKPLRKYNFVV